MFLQKHCVVHRDLKLSNLLLAVDGKVIICDFGKAMLMDETFSMDYKFSGELISLCYDAYYDCVWGA